MRGRTLNDAFVILDEAQNATVEQMKMFLTRLGFYSKMVITGDITQVDLPNGKASGLIQIQHILHNIDGIDFVYFRNVMSFVIRSCKKLSKHTIATSYISRMLIS